MPQIIWYNKFMNAYEFMKEAGELTSRNQRHYHEFARENGLNYNTLAVLYTCYVTKSCTQKRVTTEWYVPKQTVNTVCKQLIAEGLLSKVKGERDHRESVISLTERGVEVAAPIVERLLRIENGVVSGMGEEDAEKFLESYRAYSDLLERAFKIK